MMKEIAVCFEKDNESAMVKDLENAVAELLESYEDCQHHASAIESVGNSYQPGAELTDFKKLLEAEFEKLKSSSSFASQSHPLMRQFREAIWNVHHSGQPMPGEEQEDIIMTSTQSNLLNITCPVSGKPVIELAEPVRSVQCKHIYEKKAIMHHIASGKAQAKCPITGCPKILQADKVVCDPLLLVEIEEMRSMSRQTARNNVVEDFTELDDEDD
ncbi:E3 SUMO-protein ligase MMS21 isoform X2 [Jatropha curcas]|nr:E3 SUMO-protein ligase MMS21 isoform X2 [Jatropha curcas]